MSDHQLDNVRLLFDLKLCGKLIQRFSHQRTVAAIAAAVTDGLVEEFGCVFARLWTVDPDYRALTLVASSGLHTHLNGSFASVPMGAFKVGKIAQHCIPFLSNCLAEETWVKDRDWVIANQIQGFAGLPLRLDQKALGVLAVFSRAPLTSEFLEVLQLLSIAVTGAITSAQQYQEIMQMRPGSTTHAPPLSEQLGQVLGHQELSLIGLEQTLPPYIHQWFIEAAHQFQSLTGRYCRLIYEPDQVSFEVIFPVESLDSMVPETQFSQLAQNVEQQQGRFLAEVEGNLGKVLIQFSPPTNRSDNPVPHSRLSEREQDVLDLLAHGFRDRDIAERLYISERTVKFHVKNILAKLEVRTRVQAVFIATKQGWLA